MLDPTTLGGWKADGEELLLINRGLHASIEVLEARIERLEHAAKGALFVLRLVYQREPGTNEEGAILALEDALAKETTDE